MENERDPSFLVSTTRPPYLLLIGGGGGEGEALFLIEHGAHHGSRVLGVQVGDPDIETRIGIRAGGGHSRHHNPGGDRIYRILA